MTRHLVKVGYWTALLVSGAVIAAAFNVLGTGSGQQFWSLIVGAAILGVSGGLGLILRPESQRLMVLYFASIGTALIGVDTYLDQPDSEKLVRVFELRDDKKPVVPFIAPNRYLSYRLAELPIFEREFQGLGGKVPISHISNRITVHCTEKEGLWSIYKSDRYGFNNPNDVWDIETDIVAVGDSFAHGACVPSGSGMVDRLRTQFRRTVNLGMSANGPLLMLATIREYASHLKPRAVLWFFFEGNDLADIENEMASSLHRSYLDPAFRQGLIHSQEAIDESLLAAVELKLAQKMKSRHWIKKIKNRLLLRNLRHRIFSQSANYSMKSSNSINNLRKVLSVADGNVGGWGGRLYFVYLPSWSALFKPNDALRDQHRLTLETVKSLDIPVIDIYPIMAKFVESGQGEQLFYFPGSHYSEIGYAVAAQELLARCIEMRVARGNQ